LESHEVVIDAAPRHVTAERDPRIGKISAAEVEV